MSAKPDPWRTMPREILKDRAVTKSSRNASPFFGTGMHPNGQGGLESDAFDGDLATGDAGTTGWAVDDQKMAVGELILRPGSVGNDALTNPLQATRLHDDANNFPVPAGSSGWSTIMTVSTTVPSGFTQALILNMVAAGSAINSTASSDILFVRGHVNGISLGGWTMGSPDAPAGTQAVAYDFQTGLLPGLSGGDTVTFVGQVEAEFAAWAANSFNAANLDVALLWLR